MKGIQKVAAVAAVALTVGAGGLAFAQDQNAPRQGARAGARAGGPRQGGPALGVVRGIELRGLELSEPQRQQIREIVQRYQEQARTDIMLVLTAEQQEKVKQAEAQRAARMQQRLNRPQRQP